MAVIGFCEACRRNTYVGDLEERACPACGRPLSGTRLEAGRGKAIGANQARFRAHNEAETDDSPKGTLQIVCECGSTECTEELEIRGPDYVEVRSHPARFVVAVGHNIPEAEHVVASAQGYLVVEKVGEAREEALARADSITTA